MSEYAFLSFLVDPFYREPMLGVVSDEVGRCTQVQVDDLQDMASIVTYDTWNLVSYLKSNGKKPPVQLIEISDALRVVCGRSKDQQGEKYWDTYAALRSFFHNPADASTVKKIGRSQVKRPREAEVIRLLEATSRALKELWALALSALAASDETERFVGVEVPTSQLFWQRQWLGIRIDTNAIDGCCKVARNNKYKAFRTIASQVGVSPSSLTFRNVNTVLQDTDARHLLEFSHYQDLEEYFRIARFKSEFARTFWEFVKSEQDLTSLTFLTGEKGRVHPYFHSFGTVTGRILVSNPRLQELRKPFRKVILPDESKELVYLDYSQFEPGILASLAGDDGFRKLYNRADLYLELSRDIFNTESPRNLAKRIFLAYCYGMGIDNIVKLLSSWELELGERLDLKNRITRFFGRFPGLATFRNRMEEELETTGYVRTQLGNRRVRTSTGALSGKERRWATNDVIQGTASLIFKKALIGLAEQFGKDSILLPMHDGVLLQFDPAESSRQEFIESASSTMVSVFQEYCPDVQPRVVTGSFSQPD